MSEPRDFGVFYRMVFQNWDTVFAYIERASTGDEEWPDIRECSGAWYVAGACYEQFGFSPLSDPAYDRLSRYLLENFDHAVEKGANLLKKEDLSAGTAMGFRSFPAPYLDVARILGQRWLEGPGKGKRGISGRKRKSAAPKKQPKPTVAETEQEDILGDLF